MSDLTKKDDEYWRDKLDAEQFRICREKGTERPFTGEYWDSKEQGTFLCRCCGEALFDSVTKYDSGSGWPSFYQPLTANAVGEIKDTSLGMTRVEVVCDGCGCHLGHVFPDGPQPTGLRYCINSASIQLKQEGEE